MGSMSGIKSSYKCWPDSDWLGQGFQLHTMWKGMVRPRSGYALMRLVLDA